MIPPGDPVHAIENLKALYCASADRSAQDPIGARDTFGTIFLPGVTGDYGGGPMIGAEALAGFLCTAISGSSEWLLHMLHTPLIEVTGDTAIGDWTVMVHLKRRGSGRIDGVIGRYSDAFRRTPDGWRIERVRFEQLQ